VGGAPCYRLRRLTLSTKNKRFLFRMARMKVLFVTVECDLRPGSGCARNLRIIGIIFVPGGYWVAGVMGRYLFCAPSVHDAPHAGPGFASIAAEPGAIHAAIKCDGFTPRKVPPT
jgi:hypothetical protein